MSNGVKIKNPGAAFVIIGNEILSGRTQDVNLEYLAKKLTEQGIRLQEARVIPDIEARIVEAVNSLRKSHDYVFTSGGIGPTHDDITVDALAKAFGVAVIVHPQARRMLEDFFGERATPTRMRMARTPEGAELIENPVSIAPGIQMDNVFVLAGVPDIFRAMVDCVIPGLKKGVPIQSQTLVVHAAESSIADTLSLLQSEHTMLEIGSYPFMRLGKYGVSVVFRGTEVNSIESAMRKLRLKLKQEGIQIES